MANKISVVIDVAVDRANRSIQSFRTSVREAEGAVGKFKAGSGAAMDAVKANAGQLAMAGGAALVAFGTQAVGAFQDTALEAGKMRDSLGLSAEEASRYIEVAGDLGIEIGALEATIGRMNREAASSPEKFDEIGAAIARNEDGTINVNQTFLNTVDALNKIPDAAKRAKAGQEIFGRSWMQISEMVGMGAEGMQRALDSVETGKVIDDEAIDKARRYRDSMDALKGAYEEFSVVVGEVLVDSLADAADGALALKEALDVIPGGASRIKQALDYSAGIPGLGFVIDQYQDLDKKLDSVNQTYGTLGPTITEYEGAADEATTATEDNAAAVDRMTESAERGTDAIKEAIAAYKAAEAAQRGLQSASLAYRQQVADTAQAVYEGTLRQMDATLSDREREQAARDVEAATLAQAEAAVDLAEEQAAANGETLTANQTTAAYVGELERLAGYLSGPARAEIQAHIDLLKGIPQSITTTVVTQYANRGGTGGGVAPRVMHDGGIVGGQSFAGLKADEVPAVLQKGEAVLTRDQQAAMAGGTSSGGGINIYVSGLTGPQVADDIVDKLMALRRRNGKLPWE